MAAIDSVIRTEEDGSLSFGDYLSLEKKKASDYEADGDLYKVKTHKAMTRLEKNGKLLLETVPGSVISHLRLAQRAVAFSAEGFENTRITLELEPSKTYIINVNGEDIGCEHANITGKISFSMELTGAASPVSIIWS
ncbi:MAG: endosialidase [Clostridiales bacterium]|jgi:hypothetical protein|nr:endosialidase [Clostridiales bacterium]